MVPKLQRAEGMDLERAKELLGQNWAAVEADLEADPSHEYVRDRSLRDAIRSSVNHKQVSYRFCLPTQLLGKLTDPGVDALCLQKSEGNTSAWDARSMASKVVAVFNREQGNPLGQSSDPYVGNPMRLPRMERDDKSKKDIPGWNVLVGVLEAVDARHDPAFTELVLRQTLLEIHRVQSSLRFSYGVPARISLDATIQLMRRFVEEKSGGDRSLALCAALFAAIGEAFGIYAQVARARINASDEATGQAADLHCLDASDQVVLAVEVKDRLLTLTDVEGTLLKCREPGIREMLFAARGVASWDQAGVDDVVTRAFTGGENLYVFDLFDFARSTLALGGVPIRTSFLRKVGQHLDNWNTQPSHRRAWKALLEGL